MTVRTRGHRPCGEGAINCCSRASRREEEGKERRGGRENRHANLLTLQAAFSATSGGGGRTETAVKSRTTRAITAARRLSGRPGDIKPVPRGRSYTRRGTNRARPRRRTATIFLSRNERGRRVPAIWSRYSEAPNMSYRHENWSPFGRLFGDRERHYHEYKHPTTAILMVVRS